MNRRLTVAELSDGVAKRATVPVSFAEKFVQSFFDVVEEALVKEKLVKVKGLGTFKLVDVEPRESVDINTGERIILPAHSKVTFTPDTQLRDTINRPFADFETVILNEDTPTEQMEALGDENSEATESPAAAVALADIPEDSVEKVAVEDAPAAVETPAEQEQEPEEKDLEETAPEETVSEEIASEEKELEETIQEETALGVQATEKRIPEVTETVAGETATTEAATTEAATSETSSAETASAETATAEAAPEAHPDSEAETIVEPQTKENKVLETVEPENVNDKSMIRRTLLNILAALLCLFLGYAICYYFRPFELPTLSPASQTTEPTEVEKTERPETSQPAEASDAKPAAAETAAAKPAKSYPQLEGGDYEIVGVQGTEVMSPGKTLLNISLKYFKSTDFVPYICAMNGIENPDIVPLNKELQIPELKKK